jgi:hypothetical protein
MENVNFASNLNPANDVMDFIRNPNNYQKIMYYLFSSQPKINKDYEKLSDDSKMIVDIYNESFYDIKKNIMSYAYDNDIPGTPPAHIPLGRVPSSLGGGGQVHSAHYATPSYLGGAQSSLA